MRSPTLGRRSANGRTNESVYLQKKQQRQINKRNKRKQMATAEGSTTNNSTATYVHLYTLHLEIFREHSIIDYESFLGGSLKIGGEKPRKR